MTTDLTDVATHFRFGQNWQEFSTKISEDRVRIAEQCLSSLVGERLDGRSFIDIGSGSGLSALAALRLGASPLLAVDIDPDSVRTTRHTLSQYRGAGQYEVREQSVFDLDGGTYDIVHSWGVLHHTGAMWPAIERAASLVKPDGILVLAIYLKTPFCGLWQHEKRIYTNASPQTQRRILKLYRAILRTYLRMRGIDPNRVWAEYQRERGMDQDHDLHDWLGGYPYESASAEEMTDRLRPLGFRLERSQGTKPRSGVFGTGCAEYVFRRGQ